MHNSSAYFLLVSFFIFSCQRTENQKNQFADIPSPSENPITIEGVEFGKVLFSDQRLSENGSMSCASCHKPDSFFVSSIKSNTSTGINRQISPLYNLAWSKLFFMDGSEENLESLIIKPIVNPDEMHGDLRLMANQLNSDLKLKEKCRLAFGSDSIYTALVSRAISQYIRTIEKKRPKLNLDDDETKQGEIIFDKLCAACHVGERTSDFEMRKSPLNAMGPDSGRFRITKRLEDVYYFKTPSLANISKTAPYTHNGKFPDLNSIVKGYSEIIKDSTLKMADAQKKLILFLKKL